MTGSRPRLRRTLVLAALAAALLAAAWAAATAYDHAHRDRLARGVTIGGVDVVGLTASAAERRLERVALAPRRRTLHAGAFAITPAQLAVGADVHGAVTRALAAGRRGWLGARVVHELEDRRLDERLPLTTRYSRSALAALVARVAAATDRAPVDATVHPDASGLTQSASSAGLAVDRNALRARLVAAIEHLSRPAAVAVPTRPVAPRVTSGQLAARYPAYIVVDRKAHKLRFFEHLQLANTYDIAVGRAGLETPSGLYDVQWKQVDPPWHVPNSAWAGSLAGKTIPPGPQDPIKARWMAFDGGAGIHGIDPSEYSSIGHDASHGCVRMRIPDVISLYARTPVGSPVYVV